MKRLLLLTIIASLLILGGCATVQAQGQQTPATTGKTWIMPAQIVILSEIARAPKDAEEAQALSEQAKKNMCVKEIKTPDGNTVYLIFCGNSQEPYCVPRIGKPPLCY